MNEPIQKNPLRKVYSPEEISRFIGQWKSSGKSVKAFCKEHQMNYHTFVNWNSARGKKRLQQKFPGTKARNTVRDFIPIELSPAAPASSGAPFVELSLLASGERRIVFYTQPDIGLIKSLLT